MKLSESIKPVSYLKNNTADVLKNLGKTGRPLVITQNGEATAVLQDIKSYERMMESMALLKLLAIGQKDIEAGRVKPVKKAFKDIRSQIKKDLDA